MTDIELLPCPFCRHEACMDGKPGSWGYYPATAFVRCGKCNARGPTFHDDEGGSLNYRAEAAAAWNRRAEIEALKVEVAAQRTRADAMSSEAIKHEARAERLAETLRDAKDRMHGQVKWVACDCGCERDKPADAASVVWLRAIALLRNQEVDNG